MKRFNEMTDAELLLLDEQGIADLVDLECAHENVSLLPVQPIKPVKPEHKKDATIYKVGSFHFIHQHEALNIEELLKNYSLVSTEGYGINTRMVELKSYEEPKTEALPIYTEDKYKVIEDEINKFNAAEKTYNDAISNYKVIKGQRKDIENEIEDKIQALNANKAREDELKTLFARYLQLADDNAAMALKFLNNANADAIDFPAIQELGE
jgi:hypothetical protein